MKRFLRLPALFVALSGCGGALSDARETRTGGAHPSKPAGCQLDFIQVDPSKGMPRAADGTQYEMAGVITASNDDEQNDRAVRDLVRSPTPSQTF